MKTRKKLERCPFCKSELVLMTDSQELGANVGFPECRVRCASCGQSSTPISYDWPYMRFYGLAGVKFSREQAAEAAALLWNIRSPRALKVAVKQIKALAVEAGGVEPEGGAA